MDGQDLQTLYCVSNGSIQNLLWSGNERSVLFGASTAPQGFSGIYLLKKNLPKVVRSRPSSPVKRLGSRLSVLSPAALCCCKSRTLASITRSILATMDSGSCSQMAQGSYASRPNPKASPPLCANFHRTPGRTSHAMGRFMHSRQSPPGPIPPPIPCLLARSVVAHLKHLLPSSMERSSQ